ncbi:beta-lactamase family protein [Rhodohalobacter sp. WB101]|uniref:Beta-lactamase family protein n=2 Tax=Rhodohalobacter sulfatireducens TaxID=2911366 RepID=A0ABS9KIR6_9BACT|nr:beta-lactamase family protein [Rhodohalobacter sulfatireducens]
MYRLVFLHFSMSDFKKIQCIGLIWVLFIITACNSEKPVRNSSLDQFSSYLDERIPGLMKRYDIPGVSVVLVQGGERVWGEAYGYADLTTGRRITTDTVCRVESISKSVTAWGAMKLVEEGRIGLDEPVYRYLKSWSFPESPFDESKITLRLLLSHQAGLPLGPIGVEFSPDEEKPTLRESLSSNAILIQEPGSGFFYSNVGYHLVELLIEEITRRDFAEYMKSEILEPIEMNRASYNWSESFDPPVPLGYDLNGDPVPVYLYSEKGSGGLFASSEEIANFMIAGMTANASQAFLPISQNSTRQIYEPSAEIAGIYSFVSEAYGYGHFIDSLSSGEVSVFSGGQGHGWMTHFQSIPDTGDGIVILTNSQRSWPFIGYILKDWGEWRGDSSVGMARITDAVIGIWILIAVLLLGSLFRAGSLGNQIIQKRRQFTPLQRVGLWIRIMQFTVSGILMLSVLWALNQDYFFLFSVFPVASGWLIITILFVATVLQFSALFPKESVDRESKN